MVFSRTWNAGYEATPADSEDANLGASRIRETRTDVQERGVVDHSWAGDADDGKHKQVSFVDPLGAKPTAAASEGYLYTKDVGGKAELHWEDEDGNEVQLTSAGAFAASFPSGTAMVFYQSAAPAGWTKDTTASLDENGLRLVTSTAWGSGSNGTDSWSTTFSAAKATDGHSLTVAELAAHTHLWGATLTNRGTGAIVCQQNGSTGTSTSSTGSGDAHSHTIAMDLKYVDVILASKD